MTAYELLRAIHRTCVALSIGGFALRFVLRACGSPLAASRVARVAPHVLDTVLLASALAMVWLAWWPMPDWIVAKLLALLAYIVLGSLALGRARTPRWRAAAFAGALLAAAYLVSVALTKRPF